MTRRLLLSIVIFAIAVLGFVYIPSSEAQSSEPTSAEAEEMGIELSQTSGQQSVSRSPAAILVVDRTDDSGAASACTAAANDCSLRGAVGNAGASASDDVVNFDPTIFGTPQTITLGGSEIVIANNGLLAINGPGASLLTISGNNASRIFSNSTGAVTVIAGIRFTAGTGAGAANTGRAGAVYNNGGNLTLNSVVITGNTAANGGGTNNAGTGAVMTVTNSVISNNTVTGAGGGMQNFAGATLNIANSEVAGNTCGSAITGGGAIQANGTINITNSTFGNNNANGGSGGAIYFNGAGLLIGNSTFSGNTATSAGGAILRSGVNPAGLGNTILAGNSAPSGPEFNGTVTSGGNNLVRDGSGSSGFTGTGDQVGTSGSPINAQLGSLANNGGPSRTFALLPGSPAINAGNNALALDLLGNPLTTDQRGVGFPRIVGGTVDIGAFEAAPAGPPQYQIFDIGVVQAGDTASQGLGVSIGGVAVGRSLRSGGAQAFRWTQGGGIVGLPNLAGRSFAVSNAANDSGVVVGTGATTAFGSGRLPLVWNNGVVSQLPLPAGETLGDANDVNSAGIAVGSVNGGSLQRGVIYSGGTATVITQTTAGGSFFVTAFGINDSGRIVGQGIDPGNAARNVGIVYDIGNATATEVGALPGGNGALAFGVSNSGFVTGSSMLNQGSGLPFRWSPGGGMVAVPLPVGTTQASGRGVNSAGWVVGTASSAFAIPFLWDGTNTYRLADLIPPGTGWDLSTNTSSSALGISDNNIIVGTGVLNGVVHAYAMVPGSVGPTPTPTATPTATPTNTPTATPTATPTNTMQFSAASFVNDESTVGDTPQNTVVTVTRTGLTTGASSVSVNTGTGTANVGATCTGNADIAFAGPIVLNFAAGETSKTFNVPNCPDTLYEADETRQLVLSAPTGGGVGPQGTATLIVNDTANQYRNTTPIDTFQGSVANPYPSTIVVAGAPASVHRIRVTLYDFYHAFPDNIDVLLVNPQGRKMVIMGDAGGPLPISSTGHVTLTFTDNAGQVLPDSTAPARGKYEPTTWETIVGDFPLPAPNGPYAAPGSAVGGTLAQTLFGNYGLLDGNGTWSLYIRDDNGAASPMAINGQVQSGWGLELLPATAAGVEVSGRVMTPDGRGLRNAVVSMVDSQGVVRTATTSSFGYYTFGDVEVGASYVVSVQSRRYRFAPRVVQVFDTLTDVDFTGLE